MRWKWLDPVSASQAANQLHPTMEKLRLGHSMLTAEQFCTALFNQELLVLVLPHSCAVLMNWGECKEGRAFNILTVSGNVEHFEDAYAALEEAAVASGADLIISVGRSGYQKMMRAKGYQVEPCILMKKVLHNDQRSKSRSSAGNSAGSTAVLHS
jgi:hypothetical protein